MEDPRAWKRLIEEGCWEHVTLLLLRYTQKKVHRLIWGTGSASCLPQGCSPEDLVYEAIARTFAGAEGQRDGRPPAPGERRWDPERDPDLLKFLYDTVDSLISNLVRSWENRTVRLSVDGHEDVPNEAPVDSTSVDPDEFVLTLIDKANEKDPKLGSIVQAIWDGYVKPADIAVHLGLDISFVYNAKRALKQMAKQIKELRVH